MALDKVAPIVIVTPFNVMTDRYDEFIEKVRKALAGTAGAKVGPKPKSKVESPVLDKGTFPVEQPPRWIHVELHGKTQGTTTPKPKVAIRSDDAYIMGFTNSTGRWFQLSKTGTTYKLVDDKAVMAGFDGNYNTLVGGVNNLPTLNLNKFSMAQAAAALWNKASTLSGGIGSDVVDDDDGDMLRANDPVKQAVATLAVAVCEAARFSPVSKVVNAGWIKDKVSVTPDEVNYIKEWGDLSTALLSWMDKQYKDDATIFKKFNGIGITNGEEALAVVRLVKLVIRSNMAAAPTTDEQILAYAQLPKHGRYMAEVFAVRIPATAGGDRPAAPSLCTAATAAATSFTARKKNTPRSKPAATARVTWSSLGHRLATSAYGPIVFNLDLHDGNCGQADEEEDEKNTGRIVCDAIGGDFSNYNKAISETVLTRCGPAEVIYAVLSNGVQGRVDVKLAGLQSRDEVVLVGRIVARSKLFDFGCVLFYNEAAGVRVRPGELVPLARHALAVPLHMPLTIELDIRHGGSGDEIVRGELEFKTAIDGLHTGRLVGVNDAEFEVTLLWSEYPW
nr:JIP60=60 kda jasmonate-induced protein [Hordeum vulgare=barley, cv. Bonus, Peptide, 560 aa] [Hordeum vulgare]